MEGIYLYHKTTKKKSRNEIKRRCVYRRTKKNDRIEAFKQACAAFQYIHTQQGNVTYFLDVRKTKPTDRLNQQIATVSRLPTYCVSAHPTGSKHLLAGSIGRQLLSVDYVRTVSVPHPYFLPVPAIVGCGFGLPSMSVVQWRRRGKNSCTFRAIMTSRANFKLPKTRWSI